MLIKIVLIFLNQVRFKCNFGVFVFRVKFKVVFLVSLSVKLIVWVDFRSVVITNKISLQ